MKKILILLCLPMIGFGQDDKLDEIIFSNGDTIYGNVIEVGINDITYRYKGEQINNISKKGEIVKVIYATGRVQIFVKQVKDNETAIKVGKFVGIGIAGMFILFGLIVEIMEY
jgi:hypothetical protein